MCCNAAVPFEALFCAVFGAVLHVVFSVPYAWMLLHFMCVLVLSICVVCLPHYCVLLMFSGPALLENVSDVTVGCSLFLSWSGVSGGLGVWAIVTGF